MANIICVNNLEPRKSNLGLQRGHRGPQFLNQCVSYLGRNSSCVEEVHLKPGWVGEVRVICIAREKVPMDVGHNVSDATEVHLFGCKD